jgi:protein BCP1
MTPFFPKHYLFQEELVDVDFDFFDPKEIDFHTIKQLMIQLFSSDAELFNLSELSELIIKQPLLGTTVKVDGADSDPYALLTVLNMNEHKVLFEQVFKVYLLSS